MHVHINHMYCMDSIWGGTYDSRYMVTIRDRLSHAVNTPIEKDWTNLISKHELPDAGVLSTGYTYRLKPEVFKWLEDNVPDTRDITNGRGKGFCVGTDLYYSRVYGEFNIFFCRRSDALNFIKQFSCYKKPTTYFDYFNDIRKEFNFKTNTLQTVEDFSLL